MRIKEQFLPEVLQSNETGLKKEKYLTVQEHEGFLEGGKKGGLKQMVSVVCAKLCNALDEIRNTVEAARTIHDKSCIFQTNLMSWPNRANLCTDCNGGPLQNLLQTVSKWLDAILFTANTFFRVIAQAQAGIPPRRSAHMRFMFDRVTLDQVSYGFPCQSLH
jgi:hypothetical protein